MSDLMRTYPFLSYGALSAAFGVSLLAACSSTSDRTAGFTEDSGITPTQPPQQTRPDAKIDDPIVDPPDDGGAEADAPDTCRRTAPSNKCGLAPQCGCTLAETCTVQDGVGAVECVTAGLAAMGAACVNTSGCARGLTCMYGTCHAYCANPGSACTAPKTGGCEQVKDNGGAAIPNLSVCRVACDLRDATGCGTTSSAGTGVCQLDAAGNTDCAKGGTRTVSQTCTPTDDCGPTLVCAGNATTGNTCRKWCRVGMTDCGGAVVCNAFNPKVMAGATEYGGCP